MKLLKPDWINHNGNPIFSIDIHPDGSRVATGGQGESFGQVVIWNMAPIRDEKEEADASVPRILCQMDSHSGCVNCVRWSENGKYLASGGDDKLIMIWQYSSRVGMGKSFGTNVTIVEHWRSVATLRGHTEDVLDLAWSPQDVWLASCSVDNTIIIWNAQNFPEQVVALKGHCSMVKGVTWDPVGKYLASQSDDKTLKVWRTSDWKEETSVSSCFKACGGTTHVLRLNWSPDGNHIVSAHAMNNTGPTAQIITRSSWATSLDFVGHRKAIIVVRFSPKVFSKPVNNSSDTIKQYLCCAIGSKDRSLSIWLTSLTRPRLVMHEMFEKSIMDISWSRSGLELMCCSIDGSVAYMGFDESEIGTPMSKQAQQALLEKTYGKSVLAAKTPNSQCQIVESAAILNLQQQQEREQRLDHEKDLNTSVTSTPSKSSSSFLTNGDMPFKPRDKQIETRTSDGRRRITPIFLAPQPDIGELDGIPAPYTTKSIAFKTTKETSKIVVEKLDRVTLPGLNISSSSSHSMQSPPHPTTPTAGAGADRGDYLVPKTPVECLGTVAITALHTPMEVDKPAPWGDCAAIITTATASTGVVTATSALASDTMTTAAISTTKTKVTTSNIPITTPVSVDKAAKDWERDKKADDRDKDRDKEKDKERKAEDKDKPKISLSLKKHHGKPGRGRPRKDKEALLTAALNHVTPQTTPVEPTELVRQVTVSSHDLQLPVPAAEKTASKLVEGQTGGDNTLTVETENDIPAGAGNKVHHCRCLCASKVLWEQLLSARILSVAGSRHMTCVACEDRTLHLFDKGGKRLLPPLMLGSLVSVLKCSAEYVMAVTARGYLHVWNVSERRAIVQGQSLSAIMSGGDKIVHSTLTNEGVPLLTISSGKSFSFAPEIGTWMVVNDRSDRLQVCSDHHRCVPSRLKSSGPLASVQGVSRVSQQAGQVFQASSHLQQASTVSHLETQMASCLALKSTSEYRFWLETYVRYLAQEGLEEKLRAVCDDFLGPIFSRSSSSSTWQSSILGVSKREFLKQMLPIIGANLRWQRLYTEYREQLEVIAPTT